jgi:hypothetical protein
LTHSSAAAVVRQQQPGRSSSKEQQWITMSTASLRIWDSLLSNLSKVRPDMNPGAAADVMSAVDAELRQVFESPPMLKAFWKQLVLQKRVIQLF